MPNVIPFRAPTEPQISPTAIVFFQSLERTIALTIETAEKCHVAGLPKLVKAELAGELVNCLAALQRMTNLVEANRGTLSAE